MRVFAVLLGLCAFLLIVQAELVLLSNRDYVPTQWKLGQRARSDEPMLFRVFLKQQNLKTLEKVFWEVSDPDHPQYGNHWSIDSILDLVAPSDKERSVVFNWLQSNGIDSSIIQDFRDSLKINSTVAIVESLFNTQLFYYSRGSRTVIRQFGNAYVPKDVLSRVDMFSGVDDFPVPQKKLKSRPLDVNAPEDVGYVVVDVVRNTYGITTTSATQKTSVCLVEFQDDTSFNAADLSYFQTQNGLPQQAVQHIIGPYSPASPDAESSLDVQYAYGLVPGASVWFWTTTGWMSDFTQDFFNTATIPNIISMSWGWTESDQCQIINCNGVTSRAYVTRVNAEFVKIGSRGVSVFAASGDQGAPGDGNVYCSYTSDPLTPIFPGDSPYLTSVGATMLVASAQKKNVAPKSGATPPICTTYQCATTTSEGVCTYPAALITTGGGFSDYTKRPAFQDSDVIKYLGSGVVLPPSADYNATDRGFPDISGLGHNYIIRLASAWEVVDGTSCSTPVWAGITALLNDYRLNNGKKALGNINTLLYKARAANKATFHDITTGNNKCTEDCCSEYGYVATTGWDPVTGLGTPDYPTLLAYVKTLP